MVTFVLDLLTLRLQIKHLLIIQMFSPYDFSKNDSIILSFLNMQKTEIKKVNKVLQH